MQSPLDAANGRSFDGDRFNSYDGNSKQAGPKSPAQVPTAHPSLNHHYDVNQIITPAQRAPIQNTGIMAFHCIGDTGDNSSHNGGPDKRLDVAEMMEAQCSAGPGQAETPCFCYHIGDVIYPGSDEALYEKEFYSPYSNYGNAIVAISDRTLVYGNNTEYGALTIIVDSKNKKITGHYYCAVSQSDQVATNLRHTFTIDYTP